MGGGACVSSFCIPKKCVTFPKTAAEYGSMVEAVKELLILRHIWYFKLPNLGKPCKTVFEGNQRAA